MTRHPNEKKLMLIDVVKTFTFYIFIDFLSYEEDKLYPGLLDFIT